LAYGKARFKAPGRLKEGVWVKATPGDYRQQIGLHRQQLVWLQTFEAGSIFKENIRCAINSHRYTESAHWHSSQVITTSS